MWLKQINPMLGQVLLRPRHGCSVEKTLFSWLPSAGISDADMQDMQRFGCRLSTSSERKSTSR